MGNAESAESKEPLSEDSKKLLEQMDTVTRTLMATIPQSKVKANLKPPQDSDIKTENIGLGWRRTQRRRFLSKEAVTANFDGEWIPDPALEVTHEVSPSFQANMLLR